MKHYYIGFDNAFTKLSDIDVNFIKNMDNADLQLGEFAHTTQTLLEAAETLYNPLKNIVQNPSVICADGNVQIKISKNCTMD